MGMSTEQEKRDEILRPYIRLEAGKHSPVNVDLANSFWERTANKFLAVLGLMDTKVKIEEGKGLSDQNFTLEEKEKLAGLESSHYRGTYDSLSSLQSNVLNPVPGDYADVDGGQDEIVSRYIWDDSDGHWEKQVGESTQLTGSQIKTMYESQPDTNVFDDNAKNKLNNISTGATKNRADSENADKVHTHTWSQVTGAPAQATRWPTWSEVTGKPSTFAPSSHNHTSLTGTVSFSGSSGNAFNNSNIMVNGNGTENTLKPSIGFHQPGLYAGTLTQLDGNTFQFQTQQGTPAILANTSTPAAHTHPWSQVTGQPATATRWPTFDEVTGKPSTYAPSGHTHPHTQVTGLGTAATRNVGTAGGNVMEVGAFGVGTSDYNGTFSSQYTGGNAFINSTGGTVPPGITGYHDRNTYIRMSASNHYGYLMVNDTGLYHSWVYNPTTVPTFHKVFSTLNQLAIGTTAATARTTLGLGTAATASVAQTTGSSTTNVMSQKAVTDAINAATANVDASGPRPVKDHGAVATAGSQTVVCNVQESDFHIMSMATANNAGTLTIDFANMPDTVGKHFSWHVRLQRGGRKTVAFAQPVTWSGGVAPSFGTGTSDHDLIMFYKVGNEAIRAMLIDAF